MAKTVLRSVFAFKPCGCCVGVCLIAPGAGEIADRAEFEWRERGYTVCEAPARTHQVRFCGCRR